jgi:hypothetical protein
VQHTKTGENTPNGHKNIPLQDPPKFTQIRIFGLKIYHLATLLVGRTIYKDSFQ